MRALRNIKAVFTKQTLSYFRNPSFFGPAGSFLILTLAFSVFLPESVSEIVPQFVTLFTGISMIGVSAGFIGEDRATMNLRFMGMAGVKPYQYLMASAATLLLISFAVLIVYGLIGRYSGPMFIQFIAVTMLGAVNSILLGTTLGLHKILSNFAIVAGLLLGIGPNFANFNDTLFNVFRLAYTQQVNLTIRGEISFADSLPILLANMAVLLVAFWVMNARVGLDGEKIRQ